MYFLIWNVFQVSVPMVAVDSKSRFANHIAELHDVFHETAFLLFLLCRLCLFAAISFA